MNEANRRQAEIDSFQAFREIGETFNYLGRICVVTGHSKFDPISGVLPRLTFDYADNLGVIHSEIASIEKLPAIKAQQTDNEAL